MQINEFYHYETKKIKGFIVKDFREMNNFQILEAIADFLETYRPEGEFPNEQE